MATFQNSTARIGVWNLAGYQRINDERKANQIKALQYLDAELVTLVEVKPASYMQELIDGLAAKNMTYHSVMLEQRSDLNMGFLYKEGVEVSNPRFIEGSDLGNAAYRKAMVADIRIGRFDAIIIAVHLKSGRRSAEQQVRDAQCKVIGEYITALKTDPATRREDIILCGDFNMIPGEDVSNFHHLGGADLMNFLSSWDLQDRFSHILPAGRANLLDGFAISRKFSTEYVRGSLRLFPMHWTMDMGRERFRERVSDHLPFVASFRIWRSAD